MEGSGFWGWNCDGVHLLGSRIESNRWDVPFYETDVVTFFTNSDIKNGTNTWQFDVSLELLSPKVGEVLTVVDTIFDHQLATEGPDSSKVELVLELSDLFSTVEDGFQSLTERHNRGQWHSWNDKLDILSEEFESLEDVLTEKLLQVLDNCFISFTFFGGLGSVNDLGPFGGLNLEPTLEVTSPLVTLIVRVIQNTSSGDSSGGGIN